MSDQSSAPAGSDAAPATEVLPAAITMEALSAESASDLLASLRKKEQPDESAEPEQAATAEPELPDEGNSDPETDPAEEPEGDEPDAEKLPPIERPRSWTKDVDTEWQSLPRTLQEKIAAREQERDAGLRRSQNEAAEKSKAIQAEIQKAEKVRQDYEAKLPALMQALQDANAGAFSDIKNMDDVSKLANEDPFRYLQWQAHQQKMQAVNYDMEQSKVRQSQEKQSKRAQYEAEQNALLKEYIPDIADQKKAAEMRESAIALLQDNYGLKIDTLSRWMQDDTGHEILANAGIQKLIADGLKLKDIQNAPKAAAAKTLPKVQKPGTAAPRGAAQVQSIQALNQRFNSTGSVDDALALLTAQRKAS